eukprot:11969887-Alexandrium_andersonii.AAC.1
MAMRRGRDERNQHVKDDRTAIPDPTGNGHRDCMFSTSCRCRFGRHLWAQRRPRVRSVRCWRQSGEFWCKLAAAR